ncbi:glycosyltransferase family 4 protein [Aquihabitans sp. McL0605]|uniref:glycosyltransferase family 4 protein n=1 Tax=Aquihabitans sp. McL0605 TaxID=3415671 RepID=UPI003CEE1A59
MAEAPTDRPLKVTFVALNYAPSVGGAQEHIRQVAEGLTARGHQVDILTTDALTSPSGRAPGVIPEHREVLAGVEVRRFAVVPWMLRAQRGARWVLGRIFRADGAAVPAALAPLLVGPASPGLLRPIRAALRTSDVVVACPAPFLTLLVPTMLPRPRARVVSMPLLHASSRAPGWWVRRALRRVDGSTASTGFERDLLHALGVPSERIDLLPPGTSLDRFAARTPSSARAELGLPERPTIGYVGRLASYKGIDTLLDAAPLIWDHHPDTTVLVAGARTTWSGHRDHPVTRGEPDRVVVREDLAFDEIPTFLSACDVIAFPSRDESFGMQIIESWAARRPVVAAGIPAVRDVIRAGIDGELVDPGDHVALARELGRLLDEPDRARRMGEAGRIQVVEHLTWTAIVDRWSSFLHLTVRRPSVLSPAGRP